MKSLFAATLLAVALALPAAAAELPSSAPLFAATLKDLDGKPVALAAYKGKPLIVNFWARWCAPCRAEIPELNTYRKRQQGKLEILGIGIEDDAPAAKAFAAKYAMDYPVFVAGEHGFPLMQGLGNRQGLLPYTLFVDRHGKVVQIQAGQVRPADLAAIESKLLAP